MSIVIKINMNELIIADDHPLFRQALAASVERLFPQTRVLEVDNISALMELVELHPEADMLLLDLTMPGATGYSALVSLRANYPQLPVVMISAHEDPQLMRRALDLGAMGFIPKSASMSLLSEALEAVMMGNIWAPEAAYEAEPLAEEEKTAVELLKTLTPQQFRVLQMVSTGLLNKQIAYELGVTEATVKTHMTAILRKLGVTNRTHAVLIAQHLSLLPDDASEF